MSTHVSKDQKWHGITLSVTKWWILWFNIVLEMFAQFASNFLGENSLPSLIGSWAKHANIPRSQLAVQRKDLIYHKQ